MTIARSVARAVASPVASPVAKAVSGESGEGGVSYDADALAYFTAVEGAGGSFDLTGISGTYTESYVKQAHSDLFAGLKADNLWSKITEFYLLVGKTFGGLAVKAKGVGTLANANFVAGDYVASGSGAGLIGNGSSKSLATGLLRANSGSYALSVYVTNMATGSQAFIAAGYLVDTTNGTLLGRISSGANDSFYNGAAVSSAVATGARFIVGSSRAFGDSELYNNGISIATGSSVSNGNVDQFLLFRDRVAFFSGSRIAFAHVGTGLTDDDVASLSSRINTFMTSMGTNVY